MSEISPAMLAKLKLDAKGTGILASFAIWAGGQVLMDTFRHFYGTEYPDAPYVAGVVLTFGFVIGVFASPKWLAHMNIHREIVYRRQHGKWRWDH